MAMRRGIISQSEAASADWRKRRRERKARRAGPLLGLEEIANLKRRSPEERARILAEIREMESNLARRNRGAGI